jgi:DnaJ-class molecular chaperone
MSEAQCPRCEGSGKVIYQRGYGPFVRCDYCGGAGVIVANIENAVHNPNHAGRDLETGKRLAAAKRVEPGPKDAPKGISHAD